MTYDANYPPAPPNPPYYTSPQLPEQQKQPGSQAFVTVLFVALAFTAGWLGNNFINGGAATPASARPYAGDIWSAWKTIDDNYVDTKAIDHKKMTYAMISAMVDSLGDTGHSRFLSPDDVKRLNQQLNNDSFVGIGVYLQIVQTKNGQNVIIESTIPDSPANKAGLLPGDAFVAVNGASVAGKSIDDLGTLIRGPENTSVTITIQRPGETQTRTFTVQRAKVTAQIVTDYYFAEDHIGYIKIDGIDTGATDQLTSRLKDLQQKGATSLILDLRGNGGGYVDEAQGILGDFLPSGTTFIVERDRSGNTTPHKVNKGLDVQLPMTVLVDNGTASAAEIITLALQSNRPGIQIIGQKTFGTDTVLQTFQLPDGSQLLLGVAQFETPQGVKLSPGNGLDPTQPVALPANAFPFSPSALGQLNLSETDVLNCQGITVDTQLITAIHDLVPARTSVCANVPASK